MSKDSGGSLPLHLLEVETSRPDSCWAPHTGARHLASWARVDPHWFSGSQAWGTSSRAPQSRQTEPATCQLLLSSPHKFHLKARTPGCGGGQRAREESREGRGSTWREPASLRAREEGTAGGHNTCVLSHASQVMDTEILRGWPRTYQYPKLPSRALSLLGPGCHRLCWGRCSPGLSFDLTLLPRAHSLSCCPCLPATHALPSSLRRATTEPKSPLST